LAEGHSRRDIFSDRFFCGLLAPPRQPADRRTFPGIFAGIVSDLVSGHYSFKKIQNTQKTGLFLQAPTLLGRGDHFCFSSDVAAIRNGLDLSLQIYHLWFHRNVFRHGKPLPGISFTVSAQAGSGPAHSLCRIFFPDRNNRLGGGILFHLLFQARHFPP
jgi:hypothetical protein